VERAEDDEAIGDLLPVEVAAVEALGLDGTGTGLADEGASQDAARTDGNGR
jgi:hypothetical protein